MDTAKVVALAITQKLGNHILLLFLFVHLSVYHLEFLVKSIFTLNSTCSHLSLLKHSKYPKGLRLLKTFISGIVLQIGMDGPNFNWESYSLIRRQAL